MYTQDFGDFGKQSMLELAIIAKLNKKRKEGTLTEQEKKMTNIMAAKLMTPDKKSGMSRMISRAIDPLQLATGKKILTKPLVKIAKKTIDPLQLVTGKKKLIKPLKRAVDPLGLGKRFMKKDKSYAPMIIPTNVSRPQQVESGGILDRPTGGFIPESLESPESLDNIRGSRSEGFLEPLLPQAQEYPEQEAQWYSEQEYYPEQESEQYSEQEYPEYETESIQEEVKEKPVQEVQPMALNQGGNFMSYLMGIWNKLIEDQKAVAVTSEDFVPATRILEGYPDDDYGVITPSIIDQPMGVFSRGGEVIEHNEYDNRNINRPQLPGIVSFSGFGEEETSFWDKLGEGLETIKPAVTGVRKIIQGIKKEQQPMTSTPIIPPRTPDTGLGMFAWVGLGLAVAGGAYLILKRR